MTITIILLIALALVFDFLNGFHDSANAIATVVSTRVLSPGKAVIWAAFFEFLAFFFFGSHVANTIGKGIVNINIIDSAIVFGALAGACAWNIITWYFGLPSSSSHALIGGLIGAAMVKAGPSSLLAPGIIKVVSWIVISPVLGFVLGRIVAMAVYWMFSRTSPSKVDQFFRRGQLVSSALFSMGHGGNDAQKTMGIVSLALVAATRNGVFNHLPGWLKFLRTPEAADPQSQHIALWIKVLCALTMGAGTAAGGWRVIKTLGHKLVRLQPVHGFAAETAAASVLLGTALLGMPVSTTHVLTSAIIGVGAAKRWSALKWSLAEKIVWAWVFTLPASGALAYILVWSLQSLGWTF